MTRHYGNAAVCNAHAQRILPHADMVFEQAVALVEEHACFLAVGGHRSVKEGSRTIFLALWRISYWESSILRLTNVCRAVAANPMPCDRHPIPQFSLRSTPIILVFSAERSQLVIVMI